MVDFYENNTNPTKMELQFDEHGLITPKEIIELSLVDFERIFVKERKEKAHRQTIFEEYVKHNEQIQKEIGPMLFQFVNGSFTTLKAKPNDIDVISFIDYRVFRGKEEKASNMMATWKSKGKVDGYSAAKSYPGHPHFIITQLNYEYWKDLFTLTKPNDHNQHFRKGLIQINFHEK